MNEGANKGILVTNQIMAQMHTNLPRGSRSRCLMAVTCSTCSKSTEYKARINIQEAKKLIAEREGE